MRSSADVLVNPLIPCHEINPNVNIFRNGMAFPEELWLNENTALIRRDAQPGSHGQPSPASLHSAILLAAIRMDNEQIWGSNHFGFLILPLT